MSLREVDLMNIGSFYNYISGEWQVSRGVVHAVLIRSS